MTSCSSPKLLCCRLRTVFLTCVHTIITSINSLFRVSVITSFITFVYVVSCLSDQISLSQQVPGLYFYCLYFWVVCPYVSPSWCLSLLECMVMFSSLNPSFALLLYVTSPTSSLLCWNVAFVSVSSFSLLFACGAFFLSSPHR